MSKVIEKEIEEIYRMIDEEKEGALDGSIVVDFLLPNNTDAYCVSEIIGNSIAGMKPYEISGSNMSKKQLKSNYWSFVKLIRKKRLKGKDIFISKESLKMLNKYSSSPIHTFTFITNPYFLYRFLIRIIYAIMMILLLLGPIILYETC